MDKKAILHTYGLAARAKVSNTGINEGNRQVDQLRNAVSQPVNNSVSSSTADVMPLQQCQLVSLQITSHVCLRHH